MFISSLRSHWCHTNRCKAIIPSNSYSIFPFLAGAHLLAILCYIHLLSVIIDNGRRVSISFPAAPQETNLAISISTRSHLGALFWWFCNKICQHVRVAWTHQAQWINEGQLQLYLKTSIQTREGFLSKNSSTTETQRLRLLFPTFCPGVYIKSRCWIPDGSEPMTPPQLQPPILWMESAWRPLKSFPHQRCVALWHHKNLHTASWHLVIPEKPLSWYDLNRFPLWICCMATARNQVLFDWFPIAVVQTQPAAAVSPASRHVPVPFFPIFSFDLGPIESVVIKTTLISKKCFVFFFRDFNNLSREKFDLEPQSFKHRI